MSHLARQRSADGPGPETWYGEPQHDVVDDESIEFERYGEPNHEQPSPSLEFEFVPGIEYYPERTSVDRKPGRPARRMTTLLIGD